MKYPIDVELRAGAVLMPELDLSDVAAFRRLWERISQKTAETDLGTTEYEDVEAFHEGHRVRVRLYTPLAVSGPLPAVLLIHGGAFVGGSVDSVHVEAQRVAVGVGAVVVVVDYRLAPEQPYPAALDDCWAALQWLLSRAGELEVDPMRIALHGMSAGGALAAATALRCRDTGEGRPAFLYLNAPVLDDRMTTASMREYVDTPVYTRTSADIGWRHYLGASLEERAEVPVYAAPARSADLGGLPATYIAVMQFDPLRDEGIAFAQALLTAGVPVELHVFPETFHGSSVINHAEVSQRETAEEIAVLRKRLRTSQW